MNFRFLPSLLSLLLGLFVTAKSGAQPTIKAVALGEETIAVDGRLNEEIWTKVEMAKGMTERQPTPGRSSPIAFEFAVVYDDEALYFGMASELQPGETPRSLELRRDTYNIWSDDAITIKVDVHRDRLTTIGFAFNGAGAQTDYIAITNAGGFRREFDAVWESESTWNDTHWFAEVRIPFAALGMPETVSSRGVGLNITRDHNARLATYDWAALPPELGPVAATHYGTLTGLQKVSGGGRPLRLIPYALMRSSTFDEHRNVNPYSVGLDTRLRISQELWGEFTALTDFAEVDLDDALINLTRFPLFLPEKRPFFLSGVDIFNFGDSGSYQLFYSRRIGLSSDGRAIPLLGGTKVHGRIGALGVGLLTVMTDDFDGVSKQQYSVARLRHDLGGRGGLGFIYINRVGLGSQAEQPPHHAVGIDGAYRLLNDRLQLSGYSAFTHNRRDGGREGNDPCNNGDTATSLDESNSVLGTSSRLRMRYVGSSLESDTRLRQVDCRFDAQVGFFSRRDLRTLEQDTTYVWRGLQGVITRFLIGHRSTVLFSDETQRYLGAQNAGVIGWTINNRFGFEIQAGFEEDVVVNPFELPNGRQVEGNTYRGGVYGISMFASQARNPYGEINYTLNDAFYGGRAHRLNLSLGGALGAHVRILSRLEHNWLEFEDSAATQTVTVNQDLSIAVNPKLFADVSLQANTVNDLGRVLARLRWRYAPGSDLYMVYEDELGSDKGIFSLSTLTSRARSLTLKVAYWHEQML